MYDYDTYPAKRLDTTGKTQFLQIRVEQLEAKLETARAAQISAEQESADRTKERDNARGEATEATHRLKVARAVAKRLEEDVKEKELAFDRLAELNAKSARQRSEMTELFDDAQSKRASAEVALDEVKAELAEARRLAKQAYEDSIPETGGQ